MASEGNSCNGAAGLKARRRATGSKPNMKTLHLLRHVKSSTKGQVEDHERPLSRRGREAALRIAKHLPARVGTLDLVLCSSALRTRETLDLVLADFVPQPRCLVEGELYLASQQRLMDRLRRLDARDANVLLIGHNPGLNELAIALTESGSGDSQPLTSGKFPTGACASFHVPADWSALGDSRQELVGYFTPEILAGEKG
jgi:phosphohistidine phosphatase